jgi:3-phosphoinositide dependent protein kinase-1
MEGGEEDHSNPEGGEFGQTGSKNNERRGTFVGTAYYVSPEMLKENIAAPASDIWALGCIIYRMLTGDVPFSGSTDYQTF